VDALYFRVSSERQTTENQFKDPLLVAEKDGSARDWNQVRQALATCLIEEHRVPPVAEAPGPLTGSSQTNRGST
jgi:hypothetical protein